MNIATPHSRAVRQLLDILGVPKLCVEVTITFKPDQAILVNSTHMVDDTNLTEFANTIKLFELVDRTPKAPEVSA